MNNTSKIVFLINDEVRAVTCRYDNDKDAPNETPKIYKTFDDSIMPGDFVIVPTGTRHGMTVVKVVETDIEIDFDNGPNIDWIIGRVDTEMHQANVRAEKEAIIAVQKAERSRKRAELKQAMFENHEEQLATLAIASPAPESAEVVENE